MDEIIFQVEPCPDSAQLVAFWDDPSGGGITTQCRDLGDLEEQVADAVRCHFEPGEIPKRVKLHFVADPVLAGL
ncbi:MAG: 2-oxoisovalerate dehydrogenase [Acidobacteriota bacterium]